MGQPNISQGINIDIILFSSIQPTTTHPLKMGNCPNSYSNVQSESMEMLEHEVHIFFCNFFWPYSVVIDERRFRQFLAVTSREWQGGAFSGGKAPEAARADAEKSSEQKVRRSAAALDLGQLNPQHFNNWNKEKTKLHFSPEL